jgi:anti-sigma B factor antagonist
VARSSASPPVPGLHAGEPDSMLAGVTKQPKAQSHDSAQPGSAEPEQALDARLRVQCHRYDESLVVVLENVRLDAFVAPELGDYLNRLDFATTERVVFDLSRVEVLDSSALAAILQTCREVAANVEVRLVAPSGQVSRLLRITEVDRLIPVYATLASALANDGPAAREPSLARAFEPHHAAATGADRR